MKKVLICFSFTLCYFIGFTQTILPYKNPQLPIKQRVQDLLKRMNREEKFRQLFMIAHDGKFDSSKFQTGIFGLQLSADAQTADASQQMMNYTSTADVQRTLEQINSIQKFLVEKNRLGIPAIFFAEALHGLIAQNATSFPQSIALAASFDTSLMHKVANAIALETQQRGYRQVLSPVINVATDVRWGRVEETYGEDPFLNSEMGVAYVQEFERKGIITTPKHFVANVSDGGRDSYPVHLDERTLNEIYFPPFKACVQMGGSRSIMSSYNSLNGEACSMNNYLLNKKLKQEWGLKGFVISDAGAVGGANVLHNTSPDYPTSGKQAIENGLDVIFQTSINHDKLFNKYFLNGRMSNAAIDSAVARVLQAKFELGLFENPYATNRTEFDFKKHQALAKQAAIESMVLLKNKNQILPINVFAPSLKERAGVRFAIIGKDALECRLGGYSGTGIKKVNLLDGLKSNYGISAQINFSEGVNRTEKEFTVIPKKYLFHQKNENGISAQYFDNLTISQPSVFERNEDELNFHYTFYSPNEKVKADYFSAEFSTQLISPKTGKFKIGLEGNDGFSMYINGKLVIDNWQKISFHQQTIDFDFKKDSAYNLKIQFYESAGNAQLKLIWNYRSLQELPLFSVGKDKDEVSNKKFLKEAFESENNSEQKIKEAIAIAKQSNIIIVCAGIEEGEFQDRKFLSLPGKQEEMILRLAALHKPIIVLLFGGSAITMNRWMDSVDAVIDCWYGGEQQGNAIAELLSGDANFSAKLPITFPMNEGQCPLVYHHQPTGRGDDYVDGTGLPLFPFGFGLSYSTFEFSNLKIDKTILHKNEYATAQFELQNTSKIDGAEVVQLYINQPLSKLTQPVLALKQFQKVFLKAGEKKTVTMKITPEMLRHFDNNNHEVLEDGNYKLMIGNSSRELKLKELIKVE
jgi:beta-glucosidase